MAKHAHDFDYSHSYDTDADGRRSFNLRKHAERNPNQHNELGENAYEEFVRVSRESAA